MHLDYKDNHFELRCHKEDNDLARKAGFTWNSTLGCWTTLDGILARSFRDYGSPEAIAAIEQVNRRLRPSAATDSSLSVPAPDGLELFPFQRAGVDFALKRENTLIADGMRLGKTVQAIGVVNSDRSTDNVLVITKAALKINWEREFQKWLVPDLSVEIASSDLTEIPNSNVVITNYENVAKQRSSIDRRTWDLVVFDESHKLANPDTIRTRACFGDALKRSKVRPIRSRRRLALSGTPITKRPVDLWPISREFDPKGLGTDWYKFTKRYCQGWEAPWGYDVSGKSNLEELQDRLRTSFMIRRLREDVLDSVPAIQRTVVTISSDIVKDILAAERSLLGADISIASKAEFEGNVDKLKRLANLPMERYSKVRHELGVAKIRWVVDLAEDVLEEYSKIVIFAHHQDVIKGLQTELKKYGPVTHYGDMSGTAKQESVDKFATNPKYRVFIGSITGAEGYSVAAADYCLFAEFDWTTSTISQAEDRIWLMHKKQNLVYDYLVFDGSLDANMARAYVEGQDTITRAVG